MTSINTQSQSQLPTPPASLNHRDGSNAYASARAPSTISESISTTSSSSSKTLSPRISSMITTPSSSSGSHSTSTKEKPKTKSKPKMKTQVRRRYDKPDSRIHAFFWRANIWLNSTFPGYMLESWEVILLTFIFGTILLFLITSVFRYLPMQLSLLGDRTRFYVYGPESASAIAARVGNVDGTFGSLRRWVMGGEL